MTLYTTLSTGAGTREATELGARLAAWHDAMVSHERRIRAGTASGACDEECAHAEARALWREALATFGHRAHELAFLRSRAQSGDATRGHRSTKGHRHGDS
jgi:hypothetical protein